MTAIFEVHGLKKHFGGVVALNGVDLAVGKHEILGVVGPNGSGKTTLFNVATGVFPPTAGRVVFQGKDITNKPTHVVAKMGIGRTFQQAMAFPRLTVDENVRIASSRLNKKGGRSSATVGLSTPDAILDFVGLRAYQSELAGNLAFGHLRKLGVGLALGIRPQLLLLDEPAAGLNDQETAELAGLIHSVRARGISVCIIDHDMNLMMTLCDRLVVLDFGIKIAEGAPEVVRSDPKVVEVYLGSDLEPTNS